MHQWSGAFFKLMRGPSVFYPPHEIDHALSLPRALMNDYWNDEYEYYEYEYDINVRQII